MATDLVRGAYSGKETFLYYNSGTHAVPVWEEVPRCRNVSVEDGPALADVEFHGSPNTSQIPGYKAFSGSLEYVRSRAADAVYTALKAASENGDIIELMQLNAKQGTAGAIGWTAPCIFGGFSETANGGDAVVASVPFSLADAYDAAGNQISREPFPAPSE